MGETCSALAAVIFPKCRFGVMVCILIILRLGISIELPDPFPSYHVRPGWNLVIGIVCSSGTIYSEESRSLPEVIPTDQYVNTPALVLLTSPTPEMQTRAHGYIAFDGHASYSSSPCAGSATTSQSRKSASQSGSALAGSMRSIMLKGQELHGWSSHCAHTIVFCCRG